MEAGWILFACPVGAVVTVRKISEIANEVICLQTPARFHGVGQWYRDFSQTSDRQVLELLNQYNEARDENNDAA